MTQLEADGVGMQAKPASLSVHTRQVSSTVSLNLHDIISYCLPFLLQPSDVGLISHLQPLCSQGFPAYVDASGSFPPGF